MAPFWQSVCVPWQSLGKVCIGVRKTLKPSQNTLKIKDTERVVGRTIYTSKEREKAKGVSYCLEGRGLNSSFLKDLHFVISSGCGLVNSA